jgi:DNA replication protein DnaC
VSKRLDVQRIMLLMEYIGDQHRKKPIIIASLLPVFAWHKIIGDDTMANAMLVRILQEAHRIELQGESLREQ